MDGRRHNLIGSSPAMAEVYAFIDAAARVDGHVLILGESGTGKELVARAIHAKSGRSQQAMLAVNCAALPEAMLANELFGHEKEAFTGADSRKPGRFEQAAGSTLFLDEIGDSSPEFQAQLLRAVEYGEIQRLGSNHTIQVNVRVIAATNRDLEQTSRSGGFRSDLFYRLKVLSVQLPALRSRKEDIPALISYFAEHTAAEQKRPVPKLSQDAHSILYGYDWPGNIRELQNAIERAMSFCSADVIEARYFRDVVQPKPFPSLEDSVVAANTAPQETLEQFTYQAQRRHVESVFRSAKGNLKTTAEILGIHPRGLFRVLDRLDLGHLKKFARNS